MDGWKPSTSRFPEFADFFKVYNCHIADIDWYERMSTNPPLVYLQVEMPLDPCEEEDAILEQAIPMIDSQL